jgi:putative acetyltransferase
MQLHRRMIAPPPLDVAASSPENRRVIELREAASAAEIEEVRGLFREYERWVAEPCCFATFEQELARLPGDYGPPAGRLFLASEAGVAAGCAALRRLDATTGEMKRLYVRPAFRRFGLGRLLAQALLDRGLQAGYSAMLLDTLDDMEAARGLYASLGFEEIPPYYFNPIPGAHYLKAVLG